MDIALDYWRIWIESPRLFIFYLFFPLNLVRWVSVQLHWFLHSVWTRNFPCRLLPEETRKHKAYRYLCDEIGNTCDTTLKLKVKIKNLILFVILRSLTAVNTEYPIEKWLKNIFSFHVNSEAFFINVTPKTEIWSCAYFAQILTCGVLLIALSF